MQKPKNYDNTLPYDEQEGLELGGHILKIIKVEETKSNKSNRDMLKIYLDTDKTDKQPDYFKRRYDNDSRTEKKWGCIMYQLIEDTQTGETNRGLVSFHTAVEKSNSGFKVTWGDKYCDCFKNKLIGGVFGREQYINRNGQPAFSTKCFWFRSVDVIKKGVDVPADKLLKTNDGYQGPLVTPDAADFDLPPLPDSAPPDFSGTDDDYPF